MSVIEIFEGMKSLCVDSLRINLMTDNYFHMIKSDINGGDYFVEMAENTPFDIQLTYVGEEALQYKLYIDDEPAIVKKSGQEGYGVFCLATKDIIDRYSGPINDIQKRYVFIGPEATIQIRWFNTYLIENKQEALRKGGVSLIEGVQEHTPQQITYKVVTATPEDQWNVINIKIKLHGSK